MERLHLGDLIEAKFENGESRYIGIVDRITKDHKSADKYAYSLQYEHTDEEIAAGSRMSGGAAWFLRQNTRVIKYGVYSKAKR